MALLPMAEGMHQHRRWRRAPGCAAQHAQLPAASGTRAPLARTDPAQLREPAPPPRMALCAGHSVVCSSQAARGTRADDGAVASSVPAQR
eukprot:6204848-Pleurochrysis_carterae.AAC.2